MHQKENISSRGSFHGSRGLLIRMSIVSLTSPSAPVPPFMHQKENISSRGSFHGSRGLLIRMSIVSLTSPSAPVR